MIRDILQQFYNFTTTYDDIKEHKSDFLNTFSLWQRAQDSILHKSFLIAHMNDAHEQRRQFNWAKVVSARNRGMFLVLSLMFLVFLPARSLTSTVDSCSLSHRMCFSEFHSSSSSAHHPSTIVPVFRLNDGEGISNLKLFENNARRAEEEEENRVIKVFRKSRW